MKIKNITIENVKIPLKKPFITSLRTVIEIDGIILKIELENGLIGIGSASPTKEITGDTHESILKAIEIIKNSILNFNIIEYEKIFEKINDSIEGNTSAKAAVDMAIYDLLGKVYNVPTYKFLGGYRKKIETDITISLNEVDVMINHCEEAIASGFNIIKLKFGKNFDNDVEVMKQLESKFNKDIKFRIDVNQGWSVDESIKFLNICKDYKSIESLEQAIKREDFEGLKNIKKHSNIPIMADESIFNIQDAIKLINLNAVDIFNIKLMKTGGIYNALKIIDLAEAANIKCMVGSMMESIIGVSAAAQIALAKKNVIGIDLDVPFLCKTNIFKGGIIYEKSILSSNDKNGLGIIF